MLEFAIAIIIAVTAPAAIALAYSVRGWKDEAGDETNTSSQTQEVPSGFLKGLALRNMRARIPADGAIVSCRT
jgi:hypothetical protein